MFPAALLWVPPAKWPVVSGMRAEPMSTATEEPFTLGFRQPSASAIQDTTAEHLVLLSVSGQVSWIGGCGFLVTRVLSSVGVGRQGSEVMSPRFQDGGPFPPSDPPKAPSGLLTAHPPCPCHLPSCTESSITALPTAPWDRNQRPSFEERAPSSDLLFPSSSVSWKSHCASQGLPSLPTCTMGWR